LPVYCLVVVLGPDLVHDLLGLPPTGLDTQSGCDSMAASATLATRSPNGSPGSHTARRRLGRLTNMRCSGAGDPTTAGDAPARPHQQAPVPAGRWRGSGPRGEGGKGRFEGEPPLSDHKRGFSIRQLPHRLRLVGVSEQGGDNVLAKAAPLIRATTRGGSYPAPTTGADGSGAGAFAFRYPTTNTDPQSSTKPTTWFAVTPTPRTAQFRTTAVAGKASSASVA
jgi:hypothetical protein